MIDLWKLIELLHSSRHPAGTKVTQCPFHDPEGFEAEARRIVRAVRLGIGRRS